MCETAREVPEPRRQGGGVYRRTREGVVGEDAPTPLLLNCSGQPLRRRGSYGLKSRVVIRGVTMSCDDPPFPGLSFYLGNCMIGRGTRDRRIDVSCPPKCIGARRFTSKHIPYEPLGLAERIGRWTLVLTPPSSMVDSQCSRTHINSAHGPVPRSTKIAGFVYQIIQGTVLPTTFDISSVILLAAR